MEHKPSNEQSSFDSNITNQNLRIRNDHVQNKVAVVSLKKITNTESFVILLMFLALFLAIVLYVLKRA